MHAIARIIDSLKQYPFIPYEHKGDLLFVFPSSENGFEVAIRSIPEYCEGFYQVSYAIWHTEVDEDQAVNGFLNGLTDAVRLRVSSRGGADYRWTIQFRAGQEWLGGTSVKKLFYPFWRKKAIRYLQNEYLLATKVQANADAD